MFRKIIILFGLLTTIKICAQDTITSRQWFEKAEFYLFNQNYPQASVIYENLLEEDLANDNICFHLSLCYLNLPDQNKKAIYYLKKIFSNSTIGSYDSQSDYFIYLGKLYHIDNPEEYPNKVKTDKGFRFDPKISYTNLAISGNGKTMIFVNAHESENRIFCTVNENNMWFNAIEITSQIGSEGRCFPSSLSNDGNRLYLTKYDNFESDIYVSVLIGKSWSKIHKVGVNTSYWESHACESPDGQVLYFASNRPGGFGGMDIYFSIKGKSGWLKPVNAGVRINTFLNEDNPLLTNNGKTLIFSSQGFKKGRDGYDIYYCNSIGENLWSSALNLGYPVNTPEDDLMYVPLTEESQAYFNLSLKNTKPNKNRTGENKIFISGKLNSPDKMLNYSNIPLKIIDNKDGDTINSFTPNFDGKFSVYLYSGDYTFKFFSEKGLIKNANIFIPFLNKDDTAIVNISIGNDSAIVIKNLDNNTFQPVTNKEDSIPVSQSSTSTKDTILNNNHSEIPAQNASKSARSNFITIQIYASKIFDKNVNKQGLDSLTVYKGKDGYYRYIYGKYNNEAEAETVLKNLKNSGIKDAFITKWNKFKDQEIVYVIKDK